MSVRNLYVGDSNGRAVGVFDGLASRALLTDTVGWTGKNKLKITASSVSNRNGVDWAVQSDKSVKANGTVSGGNSDFYLYEGMGQSVYMPIDVPTGSYVVSCGFDSNTPSGLTFYIIESGGTVVAELNRENLTANVSLDISKTYRVFFRATTNTAISNLVFYPMIRRATEPAGYEPYHDSVKETLRDAEVIEGKNLADYHAQKEITSGITLTDTGTGYRISGSSIGHWAKYGFYTKVPKNTICVLSIDMTITSGDAQINIIGTTGSINTAITSQVISSSGAQTIQFNSGNYDFVWIGLYITNASSSSGDVTYNNIMICTQAEWDKSHAFAPYYEPLKDRKLDITDEQVLGAWNLGENRGTTQTLNGATFTKNADDTVTVDIAGDAVTAYAEYLFVPEGTLLPDRLERGKTYYLSGCTGGGFNPNTFYVFIVFRDSGNQSAGSVVCTDGYTQFTVPLNAYSYRWGIAIFQTAGKLTGKVFSPMISLKPNMPYVPYAMTNRELTDNKFGYTKGLTNIDANTLTKNGFYVLQSNITNVPVTYAALQVINYGNDNGIVQVLYPFGYDGEIYTRRYWVNAWSAWYKFTGAVVQ